MSKKLNSPPESCLEPAKAMQKVAPSIWVSISALVNKYNPVNLGQGFPDFDPPAYLLENLAEAAANKDTMMHQYTRSMGHVRLVEVLAKLYKPHFECEMHPDEIQASDLKNTFLPEHEIDPMSNILVTIGAEGSLFTAFCALLNPEDEVIIIEPNYDSYTSMAHKANAVPVYVQLKPKPNATCSADWVLDMDQLESKITKNTRALVLNTPHNPLGKVFSMQELEALAKFCIRHDLLCIADEVYEWFVFGDNGDRHIKIASLPGMWSRTVTVGSAGKTYSVTGWRLGWTVGPKKLLSAMQNYQQATVFACPTPVQEAVAKSLEYELKLINDYSKSDPARLEKECYLRSLRHVLREKCGKLYEALRKAKMKPMMPQAGYFINADITELACPKSNSDSNLDFLTNAWLMETVGISGIPQSALYTTREGIEQGSNYIRWCHAKKDSTLDKAFSILRKLE